MNVWLVTIGEPLDAALGRGGRPLRTGYFAGFLASRGHQVTWWTSTFDHYQKVHAFAEDTTVTGPGGETVRLIKSRGYARNVSLDRMVDHTALARRFERIIEAEPRPDIVVAAFPPVEMALSAVRFGRRHGIPVLVDLRDMWPDIFVEALPPPVRWLGRLAAAPLFARARQTCAQATGITGITDAFVDWGLERGRRRRSPADVAFPMGYSTKALTEDALAAAGAYWTDRGVLSDNVILTVCYLGSLGRQPDLQTAIRAVRSLAAAGVRCRLVVCGAGEQLPGLRAAASDLPDAQFPGWIDAAQMHVLMRRSSLGLDPLQDRLDFRLTINNKAIEYLSAGLPIAFCPDRGVLHDLLTTERCGFSYRTGDAVALAERLRELAADRALLETYRTNAKRVFEERFRADHVYAGMMAHLATIVDQRARQTSPHDRVTQPVPGR